MGSIFKMDSPLMTFLNKVADLMILQILTIICCIPLVTAGASITAMWSVLLKMARKEEPTVRTAFWSSFKLNFKQSTILGLIMMFVAAILIYDFKMFVRDTEATLFPIQLRYAIIAVALIVMVVFMYVFPLQCRFTNKILVTLRNAFFLSIHQLPKTIVLITIYVMTALLYYSILGILLPALLLLGITVPNYFCAKIFASIFKKFEPEVVEETEDEYQPLSIFEQNEEELNDEEDASSEEVGSEDTDSEEAESEDINSKEV